VNVVTAGSYHLMLLAGDYRDDKDAERRGSCRPVGYAEAKSCGRLT